MIRVNHDVPSGTKILLDAMSRDKVHLAKFVLDALDGEIVDSKTEDAQTPLISSVLLSEGQTRCKFVELLLRRGASVNCQDGNGRTALSFACESGHLDAVKILVQNNADPEILDSWGNSALMYAAVAGHSLVVDFLVRAFRKLGLQIDRRNRVGNSAVEVAKFLGHTECVHALTHNSKKSRDTDGGAQEDAQLRPGDMNKTLKRRVGHSLKKPPKVSQTCSDIDNKSLQTCRQSRLRLKQSQLPSMDSIEEFKTETDDSTSPPQDLAFSGVLTPKPPPRASGHFLKTTHFKGEGRLQASDEQLAPCIQSREPPKPILFSTRPDRNSLKPCAPSALGILLTHISHRKTKNEADKTKISDVGVRGFPDSCYQKRYSLPTSILGPTPPERTLVPLRKSKTVSRRDASPCRDEPPLLTAPAAVPATTTFLVLSNKLLRRFTSPELKNDVVETEEGLMLTPALISRSETFPQSIKHPQVDSKPSIDSISSVKCEFDFHLKKSKS